MKKFDMISLEEAGKMAIEEDCIVVDLRGRKDYDVSHIENAKLVWSKIHSNTDLLLEEAQDYIMWKEWIGSYVKAEYGRIFREMRDVAQVTRK